MSKRKFLPGDAVWSVILLLSLALGPRDAHAWGSIGHRMVAETAALLIARDQPDGWGPILARHRFEMGYYAIMPDAVYRHNDGNKGTTEAPTHFLDMDLILGSAKHTPETDKLLPEIPRTYEAAKKFFESRLGKEKAATVGTSPWRVEQLQELAWQQLKDLKKLKGSYQQGAKSEGETRRVYDALYFLGVLSHYSGDATMPYHATADWNAWDTDEGGLHFYFEADCVNELEPGLSLPVLEQALKNRTKWLAAWHSGDDTPAGVMLRVLYEDLDEMAELSRIDKTKVMLKPSDRKTKAFAQRKPAKDGCPPLRAQLVRQLAKASVLTAYLWSQVLPRGVDFTAASTLQFSDFEVNPKYVEPEYPVPTFSFH